MKLFVVNVGVNTDHEKRRGLRSPTFPDGTFEFVPIPESSNLAGRARIPTYADLATWNGRATNLAAYLPPAVRRYAVHADPEFDTHTYGDVLSPRAANLALAKAGDQLWFLARLWQHDGAQWLNDSAFHFIARLEVEENVLIDPICDMAHVLALRDRISGNAHYLRLAAGDMSTFRIVIGSPVGSARFRRGLCITPDVAGLVYGAEYGSDGLYRRDGALVLNKNGRPRTFAHFGSITRSVQAFLDSDISHHKSYLAALNAIATQHLT